MKVRLITALCLFSFFWGVFAIAWFLRNSPYRLLYGSMGMIYAASLFISAFFLKKKPWAWWLATVSLGSSILISIFDQVGLIDIVYIVIATTLFIMLLKNRSTSP